LNLDDQVAFLMKGTDYGDESLQDAMAKELRQRLMEAEAEKRPLRVYCGYDPRTTDLHLGHTITMRKLRQFQDLGHQVIFVIGTYTSLIGDPSDKDVLRKQLTPEEVETNALTYAEQALRVLDREKTQIRYNAEWLSKLTFADLIQLASNFTVQQFLTRENFRNRWEKGDAIYLHETFYSIMQGYDAYTLRADVQVGGTDQLFNIVTAARKLMIFLGEKPNIGIITGILPGTDGVIRMSKSLGNHIPLNSSPEDMYGKVMSLPDIAMGSYFRLVTNWTPAEIADLEQGMNSGRLNPRDVKMKLAHEVVSIYWGETAAQESEANFIKVFQSREMPGQIDEYPVVAGETLLDVLVSSGMVSSRSDGRRLIDQGGIRLDGQVLRDPNMKLLTGGVLQAGKRHYLRLVQSQSSR
jgi:tyrosyl-tRNA synthetase